MSDKEVLKAAITRVIKNVWNTKWDGPLFHGLSVNNGEVVFDKEEVYGNIFDFRGLESLLFDHDFCKKLWGDGEIKLHDRTRVYPTGPGQYAPLAEPQQPLWSYHGTQMFLAEDRIDYLRRNI